jgi:hypothetical protein
VPQSLHWRFRRPCWCWQRVSALRFGFGNFLRPSFSKSTSACRHRILRNELIFVTLPAGPHRRLVSRLMLRLSPHLLGVFRLEEGEGFGPRHEISTDFFLRGIWCFIGHI